MSTFFACIISAMFYITGVCIFIEIGHYCGKCKDSKNDALTLIIFGAIGVLLTLSPLFICSQL